jgi:hypothetical protein
MSCRSNQALLLLRPTPGYTAVILRNDPCRCGSIKIATCDHASTCNDRVPCLWCVRIVVSRDAADRCLAILASTIRTCELSDCDEWHVADFAQPADADVTLDILGGASNVSFAPTTRVVPLPDLADDRGRLGRRFAQCEGRSL